MLLFLAALCAQSAGRPLPASSSSRIAGVRSVAIRLPALAPPRLTVASRNAVLRRPPMMALSNEALYDVVELIRLDAKMVLDRGVRNPREALTLATDSTRNRGPLLLWVVSYNIEKTQLRFYECLGNHSALLQKVAPSAAEDLPWRRSELEARLERHSRGLRVALLALRPTIRQRVLQAAREQPRNLLPLVSNLLRSAVYRIRWKANRFSRDYGLQGEDGFQRKRNELVEKFLHQAVWLHQRLELYTGPETTAADVRGTRPPHTIRAP
jgi:hypothetical protein